MEAGGDLVVAPAVPLTQLEHLGVAGAEAEQRPVEVVDVGLQGQTAGGVVVDRSGVDLVRRAHPGQRRWWSMQSRWAITDTQG